MRVGLNIGSQPPLWQVKAMARYARFGPFDSAWVVDHWEAFVPQAIFDKSFSWIAAEGSTPHAYFDYQVLLGALARTVGNRQLAVGVTEPIRRHPMLLAQTFMSLSHLTQKPPILGIGAGERENVEPYGLQFQRPVGRLEEALQIIRMAFESRGLIAFAGDHFDFDRALMDLKPGKGGTPQIWVAAHGPRMLRLTGRYGDGWYPAYPMTPAAYEEKLRVVHRAAAEAGRHAGTIVAGGANPIVVAPTEQEARSMLDHKGLRFLGLLATGAMWKERGFEHPFGDEFRGIVDFIPQDHTRAELEAAIEKVPVDAVAEAMLWGTPDRIIERLREMEDAGMQHTVLAPASGLVSQKAAIYSLRALASIAKALK